MFLTLYVCLSVCLSFRRIAQKVDEFSDDFLEEWDVWLAPDDWIVIRITMQIFIKTNFAA